jgi:hypothetical protein
MEFRGHVKEGVVVFENGAPPEGAAVRVEVLHTTKSQLTIWQKLRKYSGAIEGLPKDMARNHDRYIHRGLKK